MAESNSRTVLHADKASAGGKCRVCLVGAGPGDPELLTVKAARMIRAADLILHDALVSPEILALASPAAQVIDVGKRCGRKNITQEEINGLLIEFASLGKLVVRLKGGDPLIFGRAGEELQALRNANIDAEVVPGITSGAAAAAKAQIPLTDRRYADRVLFLSGHHVEGKQPLRRDGPINDRTTVVVYMPGDYHRITDRLVAAGLKPSTPCFAVSRVSSPNETIRETTLGRLGNFPALEPPSLLIIGNAVGSKTPAGEWATDLVNGNLRVAGLKANP